MTLSARKSRPVTPRTRSNTTMLRTKSKTMRGSEKNGVQRELMYIHECRYTRMQKYRHTAIRGNSSRDQSKTSTTVKMPNRAGEEKFFLSDAVETASSSQS